MSQNIVAERYALALFQLAKEQNLIQETRRRSACSEESF